MRIFFQDFFEFAERLTGLNHDAEDLECADDAVSCGCEVTEDHVSALLATDIVSLAKHGLDHVAVANFGAKHAATMGFQCLIESEVAHHCGDERISVQASAFQVIDGSDGHDLVAIDELAVLVAEQHAVGVTVMRDADLGLAFAGEALDVLGMRAAAIGVDVGAGRMVVMNDQVGSKLTKNAGAGFVGGAIGTI